MLSTTVVDAHIVATMCIRVHLTRIVATMCTRVHLLQAALPNLIHDGTVARKVVSVASCKRLGKACTKRPPRQQHVAMYPCRMAVPARGLASQGRYRTARRKEKHASLYRSSVARPAGGARGKVARRTEAPNG